MSVRPAFPRIPILLALAALLALGGAASVRAEEVRVVRDEWGVPHIFAATDEGAAFALGYCQAEDRLEEMLKNYRRALGTMAEIDGEGAFRDDYIQRAARNAEVSERRYGELSEKSRATIEAFVAGAKKFMADRPDAVPAWAQEIQPWHVLALSRLVIMGWPLGDAVEELMGAGVFVNQVPYRGSNQWVVSGKRTEAGVPIALIDPHLSWYGVFRFYECRVYGETLKVSGVSILGANLPTLGHNEYLSVAMTTGSGDTADIFMEKLNPSNPLQYEVDGQWRDMDLRVETIGVKKDDGTIEAREIKIPHTRHGPIVATRGEHGYAIAVPYMESVGIADQAYAMMTSKNLAEAKAALARLELMGQNVMVATVDGDIYYQRTGKVPIRPEWVDPSKPIPGWETKNDWLGLHPADDLVQVENPKAGYMQNCNVSPYYLMKEGSPRLADYRPYIYGTDEHLIHQRGSQVLDELAAERNLTVEEAIAIAMSTGVYGAENWQSRLALAALRRTIDGGAPLAGDEAARERAGATIRLILDWNRRADHDSTGALAYRFWKEELHKVMTDAEKKAEDKGVPPPARLTDDEILKAVVDASAEMHARFGSVEVPFGTVFRCGRSGGDTYPVGGGKAMAGMGTPRAVNYDKRDDGTALGRGGQTATQIVLLTKPPKSWSVVPLGQSDHRESGHWDDQAAKLFSEGKMKDTYFMNEAALRERMASETKLVYDRP